MGLTAISLFMMGTLVARNARIIEGFDARTVDAPQGLQRKRRRRRKSISELIRQPGDASVC